MNNLAELFEWIRTVDRNNLPYNAKNISWGPKISDEKETGEHCLIFTVTEKKPLSSISNDERIPSRFSFAGIQYKTDVQTPVLYKRMVTDCHTVSNTIEPVKSNRIRQRPLKAGSESITNWGSYVATLGLFVTDKTDGQIVALSNSHVYGASQLIALYNIPNDEGQTNTINLSAYQPTGYWRTTKEEDYIGLCKRAVPIGDANPYALPYIRSSCDAAIVKLSSYDLIDSNDSLNVINFNQVGPYTFATDEEINSLLDPGSPNYKAPIFRSGRTCGPIGFPGYTNSCSLSVYSLGDADVGFYSGQISTFENCIGFRGNVVGTRGGDSGSALFALLSANIPSLSSWKVIGLVFAGPDEEYPSFGLGCRITNIADKLSIAPWRGEIPALSSSVSFTVTDQSLVSSVIELSGRKYYQLGRI